jgi:hypothetical protein
MTPKEKANQLVDNYWLMDKINPSLSKEQAKQCALIAVDELIKIHYLLTTTHDTSPSINYWKDVKKELENL